MSPSQTIKSRYNKSDKSVSLKEFARNLRGDEALVKSWLSNKRGTLERAAKAKRLEVKGKELAEIRNAVRAARSKGKK